MEINPEFNLSTHTSRLCSGKSHNKHGQQPATRARVGAHQSVFLTTTKAHQNNFTYGVSTRINCTHYVLEMVFDSSAESGGTRANLRCATEMRIYRSQHICTHAVTAWEAIVSHDDTWLLTINNRN